VTTDPRNWSISRRSIEGDSRQAWRRHEDRGGPNYRELRELFHVLHMAYEQGKKLADELLDEDEQ
jgi:hypothetical protein